MQEREQRRMRIDQAMAAELSEGVPGISGEVPDIPEEVPNISEVETESSVSPEEEASILDVLKSIPGTQTTWEGEDTDEVDQGRRKFDCLAFSLYASNGPFSRRGFNRIIPRLRDLSQA